MSTQVHLPLACILTAVERNEKGENKPMGLDYESKGQQKRKRSQSNQGKRNNNQWSNDRRGGRSQSPRQRCNQDNSNRQYKSSHKTNNHYSITGNTWYDYINQNNSGASSSSAPPADNTVTSGTSSMIQQPADAQQPSVLSLMADERNLNRWPAWEDAKEKIAEKQEMKSARK